jgi:hypothetical protein
MQWDRNTMLGNLARHFAGAENAKIGLFGNPHNARELSVGTAISKILHCMGVQTSLGQDGDETCNIWFHVPSFPKPTNVKRFINYRFNDISKSGIDIAHGCIFDRSVCIEGALEPDTPYVVKSDDNGTHDGRVKLGRDITSEDRKGNVIQRVVDNRVDETNVHDIRVPVIGSRIPFVYFKVRGIETRFSNNNRTATLSTPLNLLTKAELRRILIFCRALGLDYGELDVLRDRQSGEIYVVDVNNTPVGPPNGLSPAESQLAVREMALAFYAEFVAPGAYWSRPVAH